MGDGFDQDFLGFNAPPPGYTPEVQADLAVVDGSPVLDYTHFSLAMSASRKFARWVAWNIDGQRLLPSDGLGREDLDFVVDGRLPGGQVDDRLYRHNPLDRGHLARRADLLWGRLAEAQQANADSFFFTNITPQIETFNQSKKGGLWGLLENAVLDQSKLDRRRVTVMGGPVLDPTDRLYRDLQLPEQFWKVVVYSLDGEPRAKGFMLQQDLGGLEDMDLAEFKTYERTFAELTAATGLVFEEVAPLELLSPGVLEESQAALQHPDDVTW